MGLLIAWGATNLERRSPTERFTYGLRRTSVLAALANAILLLVERRRNRMGSDSPPARARAGRWPNDDLGRSRSGS